MKPAEILSETQYQELVNLRQRVVQLEKIIEHEARFRTMSATIPGAVFQFRYHAGHWIVDYISDRIWDLSGIPAIEIIQNINRFTDQFHPEDLPTYLASITHAVGTLTSWHYEGRFLKPDGEICWWQGDAEPTLLAGGEMILCGIMTDITKRRQTEAALKESEEKFRQLVQNLREAFWMTNADGTHILYISPAYERIWGCPPEELYQNPNSWQESIIPEDRERVEAIWNSLPQPSFDMTYRIVRSDGSMRWVWDRGFAIYNDHGEIYRLGGIVEDITQLKQTQDKLQKLNEELELRVEQRTAQLQSVNAQLHAEIRERQLIENALRQSEQELRQKAVDLEQALRDLQHAQAQLIQNEKMSSLGQLVAGVAHEINNPVNFIYGNLNYANEYTQDLLRLLQLYQKHYPHPVAEIQEEAEAIDLDFLIDDLPRLLTSMKVGADRIQKIVASLRTFSRMDEADMKEVNVHDGIDSTLMILQSRLKAKPNRPEIKIIKDYATLPLIECYAGQLNQVFMNILSNAIEALEDMIECERQETATLDASHQIPALPWQPLIRVQTQKLNRDRIEIRIADNGRGMTEMTRQKLFDPFFTTKPVGQGTGLGLSISYQIVVERHGGSLECFSGPCQGAEFVITIPIRQGKEQELHS